MFAFHRFFHCTNQSPRFPMSDNFWSFNQEPESMMRDSLTYLPAMDEDIRWTAEGSGLGLRSHFHLQLSIVRQECLKDLKDHELKSPRLRFDYLTLEFDEVNFRSSNTSSGVVCSRHGNGLKHGKGPCFLRPLNERWKYKVKHSHVYMSTYVYNIYIYTDMCRDIHILYAYTFWINTRVIATPRG